MINHTINYSLGIPIGNFGLTGALCLPAEFWYNCLFEKGELTVNIVNEETELHVITPNEPGIFGRVLGTLAHAGINYILDVDKDEVESILKG